MLKIKDLAERLGVTRQTVYNMLRDGRLPIMPVEGMKPRRWRIADVDAWMAGITASNNG